MWGVFKELGHQTLEDDRTKRKHSYNAIEGLGLGGAAGISTMYLASFVGASINTKPFVSMHFSDSWNKLDIELYISSMYSIIRASWWSE